jgi:colicin import membrane protein
MSTATLHSSVLAPQAPGGWGAGATLALAVHAGLIAALTLGVDWRTHDTTPVAAELWAAVPTTAAPPAAEPSPAPAPVPAPAPAPPPPRQAEAPAPDIAIEQDRERKRRAEAAEKAEKAEAERRAEAERKAEAAKAAAEKAAEDRLAQQREENLRRMLGQAGAVAGTGGSGTTAQSAAPSAAYQGRVKAAILPNIVYTGQAPARAMAEVEVTLAPGGTIISRRLVKRSGHADWDEAVLRAIDRTPRLPADVDGRVPPLLLISFRPNE